MSGYTQIPNCLLDNMATMQPSEFKALLAVYRLIMGYEEYREKRRRRLSLTRLVEYTGLSRQGVINAMESLEKQGLISKLTGNGVNEWLVNSVDYRAEDSQVSVPEQSTQFTEPVKSVDQTSQLSLPPSNKRKSSKENLERKDTKKSTPAKRNKKEIEFIIPEKLNTPEFVKVFTQDWPAARQEQRKKLTQRAVDMQLNELLNYPPNIAAAMVKQSIMNQWVGIFPLKDGSLLGNDVNGRPSNGTHHALKNKEIKEVKGEF